MTTAPAAPSADARFADKDLLRQFLEGRDVECPGCRYNLRDLTGNRCPECGQELALRLQLAEPRQAAMLTGLVGLSAGAGLNGLLLIYLAMQVYVLHRGAIGMGTFLLLNLIGLAVQGAALAAWLWAWKRVRRMSATTRWMLALAGWGLTLLNILIFSVALR